MKTILIIDDDFSNILILKKLLTQDYNVLYANDGLDGLHIYNNNSIDLIITDIRMPLMDGFELAKIINKKIPIIALSADIDYNQEYFHFFHHYILKPYVFSDLKKIIYELLKGND